MKKSKKLLGVYLEKGVKDKLASIAKNSKRSISSEAALRIEKSIEEDKTYGDKNQAES